MLQSRYNMTLRHFKKTDKDIMHTKRSDSQPGKRNLCTTRVPGALSWREAVARLKIVRFSVKFVRFNVFFAIIQ